jgi:ArsR family transcriptional regulator
MNQLFKALSDPTRRRILEMLSQGDMTAGQIANAFDISKPSISHHLNALKAAGLVLDMRDGQNILYSLNTTSFQQVVQWIYTLREGDRS